MLQYSVLLWLLYAGTLSSEDIGGCDLQPCQNGGTCERHDRGYRCLCSRQSQNGRLFGGENCTVALSGCDDNSQCENGGICSPLLFNGQHAYTCNCLPGFSSLNCDTSTSFSFQSRGYMHIGTRPLDPETPLLVKFSFKTGRTTGTLMQGRVPGGLLTVELKGGHLRLSSQPDQAARTLVQELPEFLSNSQWHMVEASLGGVVSHIRLLCSEGDCPRDSGAGVHLLDRTSALREPGRDLQGLLIGTAMWSNGLDEAEHSSAFLGCFRDVFVDSLLVLPTPRGSGGQVNVTVGCSDRDECESSPCQNRGRCVSSGWRNYACECHRPYEGRNCAEEYVTGRFGSKDQESYAVFSMDDDPGDLITVSMFVRTRQSGGLLLVLANSTSQYLRVWLEEGGVTVQVNNFETLVGHRAVNDGHFHLVTVTLSGTTASLFQSTQEQGSMTVRHVQAHSGDRVFVGGLPDSRASAGFGGHFKGCVQDLRINSQRLQFYPLETAVESYSLEKLVGVARGCSGDDACAAAPCLNGGVCYSMWDDFVCSCPPNTAGQRCQEVKWCELSPCPAPAACQPRPQGFECLSNVTLRDKSSVLRYRGNGKIGRRLTAVSLTFRTRQSSATLLHSQRDSAHLTVSLRDSHLRVDMGVGGDQTPTRLTVESRGAVSDGAWHKAELSMESKTREASRWVMEVDGARGEQSMSTAAAGDLDFLKEGADIFLGAHGLDGGGKLSGCLGSVEIGGLLLPFHLDTELTLPRPQEEQFVRVSGGGDAPQWGCWGASVCSPDPCENRGVCEDLFDRHRCACPSEWAGPQCADPADACVSSPCRYGTCTTEGGGFRCVCEVGYRGERCEAEVDTCQSNNCSSGATCLRGLETYACLCPQNETGQYCTDKVPEIPWYIETDPRPLLPVSTCAGTRRKHRCYNGGSCTESDSACHCLPGFTGHWCETDLDECASDPCMNGGFCLNHVDGFECVCDLNYSGVHCQMDVSDFYLYLFLGLWQSLFQLVSYLVLRLDDEPEVDWAFLVDE